MVGGAREVSWAALIRALIPFIRALPSQSDYFPKALPSNTIITLGVRIQ